MQIMSVTVFQPESNVSLLSGKTRRNVGGRTDQQAGDGLLFSLSAFLRFHK